MGVFNENIESKLSIETLYKDMRGDIMNQMHIWNSDFWYRGMDHDVPYMEYTLLHILKDSYKQVFEKSNLDIENLFIHVYKNKHGFTGYDIIIDVNYYSPEFCGGLFSVTFDFKFKHPDCV